MLYLVAPAIRWRSKALKLKKSPTSTPKATPPASSTGPIALIDETMPVIVIIRSRVREDRIQHAGGGRPRRADRLITDPQGAHERTSVDVNTLPTMPATVTPLVYASRCN